MRRSSAISGLLLAAARVRAAAVERPSRGRGPIASLPHTRPSLAVHKALLKSRLSITASELQWPAVHPPAAARAPVLCRAAVLLPALAAASQPASTPRRHDSLRSVARPLDSADCWQACSACRALLPGLQALGSPGAGFSPAEERLSRPAAWRLGSPALTAAARCCCLESGSALAIKVGVCIGLCGAAPLVARLSPSGSAATPPVGRRPWGAFAQAGVFGLALQATAAQAASFPGLAWAADAWAARPGAPACACVPDGWRPALRLALAAGDRRASDVAASQANADS